MAATLVFRLTTLTNSMSLGGDATANALSSTAMNNLFDNVTPDEASAGDAEYRALDVYNSGDASATSVTIYCNGTTSPGTDVLMAIESSPLASTTSIANESTAPTISGSFTAYSSSSKLSLPDIASSSYCRVWIKRTVSPSTANLSTDTTTLSVEYA